MIDAAPFTLLLPFALVALAVAFAARQGSKATTFDFYLANRGIGPMTNAWAICGDYFSAASFLGVAAAVYSSGLDGVWYATGFAAGFVPVLLFVAAPLRRFGHVSIPDFLGRRLDSDQVRGTAVIAVEGVVLSYLIPQAVASGLTWELLVARGWLGMSPYATGVVVAAVLVCALVLLGGMRGTTWNQALQFLFLLLVLLWLAAAVTGQGFRYPAAVESASQTPLTVPDDLGTGLAPVPDQLDEGAAAVFGQPGGRYGAIGQFALLVTLVMGTTGLPHVMNRYFTAPSGRSARLTTVWVLGFAGLFYALAVMLGTAARILVADSDAPWLAPLTVDGVLQIPEHALLVLGRLMGGPSGLGLVSVAAFAAMVSTIGGLLLAAAASWGHDVYERFVRRTATQRQAVRAGRVAVVVASVLSTVIALAVEPASMRADVPSVVATMVTWAFALAGSALTPVLMLSIWWRGTTAAGATAGIVVGMTTALGCLVLGILRGVAPDAVGALLLAPTLIAAPLATTAIVLVSRRTEAPEDLSGIWSRLHGTAADRHVERLTELAAGGTR